MRRFCMIYYLPPLFLSIAAQRRGLHDIVRRFRYI